MHTVMLVLANNVLSGDKKKYLSLYFERVSKIVSLFKVRTYEKMFCCNEYFASYSRWYFRQ